MATKKKDSKGKSKSKTEQKNQDIEKAVKGQEAAKKEAVKKDTSKDKVPTTAYYKEFSNEQVESAVEEMNEVMELNPKLDIESKDFLKLIEETVKLVAPSDEFTPPTMAVIRHVMEKIGMDAEVSTKTEDKTDSGKGKKSSGKKGSGKPKKTPVPHKDRYTRICSIIDAIKEKPKTKDELINEADLLYQKKGNGGVNLKESAYAYNRSIMVLTQINLAKCDEEGNMSYSENFSEVIK